MVHTSIFLHKFQRGITKKLRKGEHSFLWHTFSRLSMDLYKYHEDILKILMDGQANRHCLAIILPFFL